MHQHSNTDHSSSDDVIVSCSEPVRAMARAFARSSDGRIDADDLYGAAMLEICECVAAGRGLAADNPVAYLCGVARIAMRAEWRRAYGHSTASLDAPLSSSSDDSYTLYDVLSAPAAAPVSAASPVSRSLDRALLHLTALQRGAVRRRYGLAGYGDSSLKETARALHTTVKTVDDAARRARRNLAQDVKLCKVLGLEVQG